MYDLYSSPNVIRCIISRRIKLAGHVARIRERMWRSAGKRQLGRLRRRWDGKIKMDF
jgi:hypothetical protein